MTLDLLFAGGPQSLSLAPRSGAEARASQGWSDGEEEEDAGQEGPGMGGRALSMSQRIFESALVALREVGTWHGQWECVAS